MVRRFDYNVCNNHQNTVRYQANSMVMDKKQFISILEIPLLSAQNSIRSHRLYRGQATHIIKIGLGKQYQPMYKGIFTEKQGCD